MEPLSLSHNRREDSRGRRLIVRWWGSSYLIFSIFFMNSKAKSSAGNEDAGGRWGSGREEREQHEQLREREIWWGFQEVSRAHRNLWHIFKMRLASSIVQLSIVFSCTSALMMEDRHFARWVDGERQWQDRVKTSLRGGDYGVRPWSLRLGNKGRRTLEKWYSMDK